jgi:hypothetical protein
VAELSPGLWDPGWFEAWGNKTSDFLLILNFSLLAEMLSTSLYEAADQLSGSVCTQKGEKKQ